MLRLVAVAHGFFFELDFEGTDLLLMGLGQEGDREGEVVS